tara:strand:- start:89 stop:433 length:345 start_codon:yes stop_codon:yes gene_type:complete
MRDLTEKEAAKAPEGFTHYFLNISNQVVWFNPETTQSENNTTGLKINLPSVHYAFKLARAIPALRLGVKVVTGSAEGEYELHGDNGDLYALFYNETSAKEAANAINYYRMGGNK